MALDHSLPGIFVIVEVLFLTGSTGFEREKKEIEAPPLGLVGSEYAFSMFGY